MIVSSNRLKLIESKKRFAATSRNWQPVNHELWIVAMTYAVNKFLVIARLSVSASLIAESPTTKSNRHSLYGDLKPASKNENT